MNNLHPCVLLVTTETCQLFIQQYAGSLPNLSFARSFGVETITSYQSLVVEDVLWDYEEAQPFLAHGIPVFVVSRAPTGSHAVFEYRQVGVRKYFGLTTKSDVEAFVSQLSIETRRYQQGLVAAQPRSLGSAKEQLLVGNSPAMLHLADEVFSVAKSELSVLLLGETGAGKEVIARTLHNLSGRSGKLVAVNCSALPAELAESLLFGHEKGAFTGANERKEGCFAQAEGGTLFLDEVFELPEFLQAKLLRALQEGTVVPVGGKEKKVQVRVIGATNKKPEQMLRNGGLREDFLYRFKKQILIPSLRERRQDIPLLVESFLSDCGTSLQIGADVMPLLQAYSWPGNVRELRAMVEDWAHRLNQGERVLVEDLPPALRPAITLSPAASATVQKIILEFKDEFSLETVTKAFMKKVLDDCGGNISAAARMLKISRQTLSRNLFSY